MKFHLSIRPTTDQVIVDRPQAAALWKRLTPTLHGLMGPHPLHKKQILYEYPTLDTTPQQLAN
jgi:hypothetical protein